MKSTTAGLTPETSLDADFADLRRREFARLDTQGLAYLDYTGSGLYPASLVEGHARVLRDGVFGNPHSGHAPSRASTEVMQDARSTVLGFLDADASEYTVIFAANASAAIKLVAESYPFAEGGACLLTADNHNSVNGIREFAARAGARVSYLGLDDELRLADAPAAVAAGAAASGRSPRLFAFPAQSNFSGAKHPLELVSVAKGLGFDVLLDAAAFAPTNPLRLRDHPADFVALSFYKIFGYPTGVGALVARREALARLRRPWFAGGTVDFVSVQNRRHQLAAVPERFEDGTPDFLSLAAVAPGIRFMDGLGMARLSAHVRRRTGELLEGLQALAHRNGRPQAVVYGPRTLDARGGTVAFNLVDVRGRPIPFAVVEDRASEGGVAVRGGCFCNPGASERAFGLRAPEADRCLSETAERFTLERFAACMGPDVAVGAVRASVGMATTAADVARALEVLGNLAE